MFGIGMPEMILILAVALIVVGPKKLPELAKSMGRAIGEFKKATTGLKESMKIDSEIKDIKTAYSNLDSSNEGNIKNTSDPAGLKNDPTKSDNTQQTSTSSSKKSLSSEKK